LPYGREELFTPRLFHDVASRARAQHPFGVNQFVVHRDGQNGQARMEGEHVFDEFDSAAARHRDVRHHQVGAAARNLVERLGWISRLAAHFHVRLLVDRLRQAGARHRVVVHDQKFLASG